MSVQHMAGDYLSEQILTQFKYRPSPLYKVLRKKVVPLGAAADVQLKKQQHINPTFDHFCHLVRHFDFLYFIFIFLLILILLINFDPF